MVPWPVLWGLLQSYAGSLHSYHALRGTDGHRSRRSHHCNSRYRDGDSRRRRRNSSCSS